MKLSLICIFLVCLFTIAAADAQSQTDDFRPLFNGKDLTGWDGNPELWSVEDGCITGKTTGPEQLSYNQFLIWRGGVVKNFELHAKVKQVGNNTGIQYRSKELAEVGKWSVGGYQCDIHPAPANNAMVYGEKWGGILVQNGQNGVIDPDGARWLVAEREPVKVEVSEWHEYTIIAQGNHLVHKIDGQVTIDLLDFGPKTQALEGLLAFQIHRGPAMKVQIKDLMLKELPEGGVTVFNKSMLPSDAKPADRKKSEPKGKAKAELKAKSSASNATNPSASETPAAGAWKWLWNDSPTPGSGARLKKQFELADASIKEAVLRMDCDNGAKVYLNEQLVATNLDWQKPTIVDVSKALRAGKNELLAEATNKGAAAAFVASLTLKLSDGTERTILTDASWSAAAPSGSDWKPAKVVADYGARPWGDVFGKRNDSKEKVTIQKKGEGKSRPKESVSTEPQKVAQPADIQTLPGFLGCYGSKLHQTPIDT